MKNKRSGFTLVEIIITIALLSFVSVVILRLYATANQHNLFATEKSMASLVAANQIENIEDQDADSQKLFYYDQNWQACEPEAQSYCLVVLCSPVSNKGTYQVDAKVWRKCKSKEEEAVEDEKPILSYQVTKCLAYHKFIKVNKKISSLKWSEYEAFKLYL